MASEISTEDRIRAVAGKYGRTPEEVDLLTAATMRRLEYRKAHSGKACPACENDLPVSAFTPDSSRPDGLTRLCKECRADLARAYREEETDGV